jgi:hypothetical protein
MAKNVEGSNGCCKNSADSSIQMQADGKYKAGAMNRRA